MNPAQALVGPAQHAVASWMCKTSVHTHSMGQSSKIINLQATGSHNIGSELR